MKFLKVWLFPALLLCLVHAQDDFDFPTNENFPKWVPFGNLLRTSKTPNLQKAFPEDDYKTSDEKEPVFKDDQDDDDDPVISRSFSKSASSSYDFYPKMFASSPYIVSSLDTMKQPFESNFPNGLIPMGFGNAIPHRPSAIIYEAPPIMTNTINYNKPINMTSERVGGFGGLGDSRGYGAYEAPKDKANDNPAYVPRKSLFEEFPELLDMARRQMRKNTMNGFPGIVSTAPMYSMLTFK